jgi:hypothetical protein
MDTAGRILLLLAAALALVGGGLLRPDWASDAFPAISW